MATLKRFEELQIWQMAEQQCVTFYALVKEGRFKGHQSLKNQMDRASGSVMDNIAEGFDRFSKIDFRHFLVIARGSNAEFRSQLYRCRSRNVISEEEFAAFSLATVNLGVKLHHFISYLTKTTYKKQTRGQRLNRSSKPGGTSGRIFLLMRFNLFQRYPTAKPLQLYPTLSNARRAFQPYPTFLVLLLLLTSCIKNDAAYSTDPNTVVDAPLKLLLPPAEVAVALAHGTELAWYPSILMQQQSGVDRQMAAADRYVINESDMNRPWNSAYTDALNNLKLTIRKAETQDAPAYSGIARILTAMTLGLLTDAFGDIPYSQALQQSGNISPAYDVQEAVYGSIQLLLTQALSDLEKNLFFGAGRRRPDLQWRSGTLEENGSSIAGPLSQSPEQAGCRRLGHSCPCSLGCRQL